MNVFVLRSSRTKYGRKFVLRIWKFNTTVKFGTPPWAEEKWQRAWLFKRTRKGLKWSLYLFGRTVQAQHDLATFTPRRGRREYECPDCGYRNALENFYHRRVDDD